MQEIPIALQTSDSKLLVECNMLNETSASEDAAQDLNEALSILAEDASMPIAVVGMGFRGPGNATTVDNLWETLLEQHEEWSPIPAKRWNHSAFYHPDHARHGTVSLPVSKTIQLT